MSYDQNNTSYSPSISMSSGSVFNLKMINPIGGTMNYEKLINKPAINGVALSGNKSLSDLNIITQNTSNGWSENLSYIPKNGEICIYTDLGFIKIGNGTDNVSNLVFVGNVTVGEKELWNSKAIIVDDGSGMSIIQNTL